ncbi:hypothetical protein ATO6_13270 [Oceanicola sp. 22II-s10i]|nr:hypothetical protein ATO6_13270 [Oceanicola sp. 22II-s10i]
MDAGADAFVDAFIANFRTGEETGASAAFWQDGRLVADLWGGFQDEDCTKPWQENTLVNGMSSTKPVAATCFHMLVDRGEVSLDDPIDRYWPEFGYNGKEGALIRWILDHRIGLPSIPAPFWPNDLFDHDGLCAALAAATPEWKPGTDAGYHVRTYGFLLKEVFKRVSGRDIGEFLRTEVTEPFDIDYWIGLPESEHDRVADFLSETEGTIYASDIARDAPLAKASPAIPREMYNSAQWKSAVLPASNGMGNARSLSKFYAILARGGELDGKRLISAEAVETATATQHSIHERVMDRTYNQALGFLRSSPPIVVFGPGDRSFGHQGAGGALGFGDPEARVGFAYLQNKMHNRRENGPRAKRLIDATYSII